MIMQKVLGIGNALVDIMTRLDDESFLKKFNLPKGSMQLVDRVEMTKIADASEGLKRKRTSGGSAANTVHGLARLGVETGFIGKVGNDETGDFFYNDLQKNNIKPLLLRSNTETGRALALVSPDSERTFATFLGAAVELSPSDLQEDMFSGFSYLHIEGYLVQNHELLKEIASTAKKHNMKISLDLASFNVVEDNIEFLRPFAENYIDILFANEEEATAFTGKDPLGALDEMAGLCEIAVVKVGKKGSFVKKGDEQYSIDPIRAKPVDTTGAGDAYAAGFIYGLANNFTLEICGKTGSLLAGKVIEGTGAKMDDEKWGEVKQLLKEITTG